MIRQYIEHGDCYGNGCSGCNWRGWLRNEDYYDMVSDAEYELRRDFEDEHIE